MKLFFQSVKPFALAAATIFSFSGCGGGGSNGNAQGYPGSPTVTMRSVELLPFQDPYGEAAQRWLDIDDQPFSDAFRQQFTYKAGQVTLSYEPNPRRRFFVGHVEVRGLKPNFAYQLKLAGKPVNGSRGWGERGDDWSNQAIGSATRWWNDSLQQNTTDAKFRANQKLAPDLQETIYGYSLLSEFVTDENGNASLNFDGSRAYHIIWQQKQNTHQDRLFGDFNIASTTAPYYGYGRAMPNKKVRLWYEWEPGRNRNVRLPKGQYNCRFLITEESFHATNVELGGKWPTVLASESFGVDRKPDGIAENDIVFTIK